MFESVVHAKLATELISVVVLSEYGCISSIESYLSISRYMSCEPTTAEFNGALITWWLLEIVWDILSLFNIKYSVSFKEVYFIFSKPIYEGRPQLYV